MDTTTQAAETATEKLPLKEAAARLGLNPVTLKRRARANDLPAYRDGAGRWLFEVADLDTFKRDYLQPRPYVPAAGTDA